MGYWQILNPRTNDEPVGSLYLGDEAEATPEEPDAIIVDFYPDPEQYVWNAAGGNVRPISEAESLVARKRERKLELTLAADAQASDEIPTFAALVVAAKFVPPNNTQYLTASELVIFNKLSSGYSRLQALFTQVDAATSIEQVAAIVW